MLQNRNVMKSLHFKTNMRKRVAQSRLHCEGGSSTRARSLRPPSPCGHLCHACVSPLTLSARSCRSHLLRRNPPQMQETTSHVAHARPCLTWGRMTLRFHFSLQVPQQLSIQEYWKCVKKESIKGVKEVWKQAGKGLS